MRKIGKINISGKVQITDPCYELTDCGCETLEVKAGFWNCYIGKTDTQWGKYNTSIEIRHEEIKKAKYDDFAIATIGVDSGQAGFFDYDYFKSNKKDEIKDAFYKKICGLTLSDKGYGIADECGFVSRSGYGDGGYQVYAMRENGKIVGLKITFI